MAIMDRSDQEWKGRLTPMQYKVLRKKGTEKAFSGKYHDCEKRGIYCCAGCGTKLFHSDQKFESGTGWPSFTRPIEEDRLAFADDKKLFYSRTEVLCKSCMGHLGHVFDDGPAPSHLRYCLNSAALNLEEEN